MVADEAGFLLSRPWEKEGKLEVRVPSLEETEASSSEAGRLVGSWEEQWRRAFAEVDRSAKMWVWREGCSVIGELFFARVATAAMPTGVRGTKVQGAMVH